MAQSLLDPQNAITVYQGESKTFLLVIEQPDPNNPGGCIPVNLTGASLYFTVKEKVGGQPKLQKTTPVAEGIEISDARSGIARIFLDPEDTLKLSTKKCYVFDVWVILSSGKRHPVIRPSSFRVIPGVTVLQP